MRWARAWLQPICARSRRGNMQNIKAGQVNLSVNQVHRVLFLTALLSYQAVEAPDNKLGQESYGRVAQ